jgi:hypothetical protein
MGRYRHSLKIAVSHEAKAYGFALVVWTTGALVIAEHGLPGRFGSLAYLGGTLAGMTAVVLVSLGGPTATWRATARWRFGYGAVHIGSVGVAVAAGWGMGAVLHDKAAAFGSAAVVATVVYQLALGLEIFFSLVEPERDERDVAA